MDVFKPKVIFSRMRMCSLDEPKDPSWSKISVFWGSQKKEQKKDQKKKKRRRTKSRRKLACATKWIVKQGTCLHVSTLNSTLEYGPLIKWCNNSSVIPREKKSRGPNTSYCVRTVPWYKLNKRRTPISL